MTELRHVMGLLSPPVMGRPATVAAWRRSPGLAELDALVGRVSAAGLPVDAAGHRHARRAAGRRRPGRLPGGAGGADERGQARGRRAAIVWSSGAEKLVIEVTDTGGGGTAAS